jgi:hypothetical protein
VREIRECTERFLLPTPNRALDADDAGDEAGELQDLDDTELGELAAGAFKPQRAVSTVGELVVPALKYVVVRQSLWHLGPTQ